LELNAAVRKISANNFHGRREGKDHNVLVGVLGGGLQGCCTALALAERKATGALFDKNDALLPAIVVETPADRLRAVLQ
jgi:2-polyprenyl-6-methoxyphenol hydroxylase-like FAD-dependent oxidoreductase